VFNKKFKKIESLLLIAIIFIISAFSFGLVYGRAGGGEDYGSGGYDYNSSNIDHDDIDTSKAFSGTTSSLGTASPMAGCCACIIIILIVVFIVIAKKKGWIKSTGGSTVIQPVLEEKQKDIEERKANLKKSDPGWNEERFLDMAETIFFKVQEAWTKKKLEIARPFITDAVYNRFKQQIDDLTRRGLVNVLENIVIGSSEIVKIEQDNEYDSITVKFRASMKDYKIEEKTGNIVSGSKDQSPPFTEYWTFIRRAGVKTRDTHAVKEKKCPNCGAPLDINESGVCKYCKANVVSGDFDWVLSKITQKEEWHV